MTGLCVFGVGVGERDEVDSLWVEVGEDDGDEGDGGTIVVTVKIVTSGPSSSAVLEGEAVV